MIKKNLLEYLKKERRMNFKMGSNYRFKMNIGKIPIEVGGFNLNLLKEKLHMKIIIQVRLY